ncbi:MAG: methyltransferase domain-containing protein [Parvibaculum sp.]|uniref:class I SAM-dependent methyltransferase n=1 Tax=Parvibaculum sp. TaxID=2024848 RepID=UPI003C72752D
MSGRAGGDFDYEANGQGYALQRRPDPRIAAFVHEALGAARSVLNVGAGAGSYEPLDRLVLAVEPSAAMRAQRPPHLAPAIRAVAEDLPCDDLSVDAAMALVTVHQWADLARGLSEMRRVARGPVVVLTFDGDALDRFWLADYVPELVAVERRRYPPIERIGALIGRRSVVRSVPIPVDCRDGFTEAFYARPEGLLDPAVRQAQSSWSFAEPGAEMRFVARLAEDLQSGAWDARHGALRRTPFFDGSLRLVIGYPE